ncbi:ABC transporter ATP-binding protein/permease [uncultured Holdemanella sp.]|uniref:ABC transporter ATP-binding protein/permease n=1 Tax=uncultured Holdemanella sp. TaxID=1763549 RepID=UPI0028042D3A|nr:ABC transporter ATP-binding protein/permease [uncultured Holdemanella sp.]
MINKKLLFSVKESIPYIKKNVLYQWIGLICNICSTACLCLFITKSDVNRYGLFFLIFGCLILRYIVNQKAIEMSYQSSHIVKETLRSRLYKKLSKIGNSYTNDWSTAEIVQLSSEGVEQLETYFANYIPQFFYSLIAPLTLFIIISFMDLKAAFVLLICVPLIPMSIVFVQKFAKKLLNRYWGQYTKLGDSFLENLQGLTTLKIYEADGHYHEKMNVESENFRKITMRVLTMQLNSITVMDLVAYGGSALGIVFALNGYHSGAITMFQTLFIILISAEFFIPMRQLGSYFHIAMNGMAASDKLFAILEKDMKEKQNVTTNEYSICASNLHFGYTDQEVLHGIHFEAKKGMIGFVGESGSGKSTIAALLMGQYTNYMGELKLSNYDIKDINVYPYMTLVSLESYLFSGSLRDNLAMTKDVSDKEMNMVLEKVGILDFVNEQGGLDIRILEGGKNLSGGQRQRLALARALLKNSPIYIMDEATSNIDVESENKIMEVLYELSKEKLVLCISHRLANLIHADQIYCLKDGNIVESGTHEELIQRNGVYCDLFNTQKELERYGT